MGLKFYFLASIFILLLICPRTLAITDKMRPQGAFYACAPSQVKLGWMGTIPKLKNKSSVRDVFFSEGGYHHPNLLF
jgi:hypothetical protein